MKSEGYLQGCKILSQTLATSDTLFGLKLNISEGLAYPPDKCVTED